MRGIQILSSLLALALISVIAVTASADATNPFGPDAGFRQTLANGAQEAHAELIELKLKAADLAKAALTCKTVDDCMHLPMGARACGGPTSFLITSVANPKMPLLEEQIDLATKAEIELNLKYGEASTCEITWPPGLGCVSNTCVEVRNAGSEANTQDVR